MFRDLESPRAWHWVHIGRIHRGLRVYAAHVRRFQPNARLYLVYAVVTGLAFGVFRLLFNFYALSLGFDKALIGTLITAQSMAALLAALPAAYASDRLGRRTALLLASLGTAVAVLGMVLWPSRAGLVAMSAVLGLSQSLGGVTLGPFLMENSGEDERTYLFSFSMGSQMIAAFAGNALGGSLPGWLGRSVGAAATSTPAYALALLVVGMITTLSLLPVLRMRPPVGGAGAAYVSPFAYARSEPRLLGRLVGPMLVTSLGAGLFMPFMNVFFREQHAASDATIGTLFGAGSLFMGLGLLAAPPLADRFGKIEVVIVTQLVSIPFMLVLGFAPWFAIGAGAYLVRLALMNMSNPVYQTFVMEQVEPRARATVASLTSMTWNFGWTFSPTVSGVLQDRYGFGPVYLAVAAIYAVAIYMYWRFFWRDRPAARRGAAAGIGAAAP